MGAPFKIGDRVVAVRNHSQGAFKIGDEFTIVDVKMGCCDWDVDIGMIDSRPTLCECGKREVTNVAWFDPISFAPLLSTFSRMTFKEVINEVVTCDN